MENEFLDKVEDNATVRSWSEKTQLEKGDSVIEGYISELWDFTRISAAQNELQELKDIWPHLDDETKQLFYHNHGDLPYLLDVKVDKHLFRAIAQFWNPAYNCFTFGKVDLVPTMDEYTTLLRCPRIRVNKAYFRAASTPTLVKKLMNITGMTHPDVKRKVDVLALSIYGLVIFPKALRHIDEAVTDLFDRLGKQVTPVPIILAETFISLSECWSAGEGRFIGCVQLLLVWFHSHFWRVDKVPYRVFFKSYSPLKEAVATPRRDDISEERWMEILQSLREENVE
ncbi:Nucleoside-triphosphatase THEP1 [Gossypium australe]|uniref:Nucleoside-triphosphatase THEP1 n=1 Tax=Gossypium australe TaxID=47621 RepID=A0A5B6VLG5_9ROSI|nr:Nucleoside-triphosphatase THEP1 [Gossypium australe]